MAHASGTNILGGFRTNPLFAVSFLSIVLWSGFVIAWEPASSHYWVLNFFPALVCLGILLREGAWHGQWVFTTAFLLITGWNGCFNHAYDNIYSRNFPEPLLASIEQHLGRGDVFIVLGNEGQFGGMDYELLFTSLQRAQRNPGVAILEDFVWPAGRSRAWRDKLRHRINRALDSGGRAFVAAHVFDPDSYADLSGTMNPFAEFVDERHPASESGSALFEEVRQVFAPYKLKESDFRIGLDQYFTLER